jgi:hypothetical protein
MVCHFAPADAPLVKDYAIRHGNAMTTQHLPNPQTEPVLEVARAGALFHLGRSASYDAVRRGDLPSIRLGRRVVVPTALVLKMLGIDDDPRAA